MSTPQVPHVPAATTAPTVSPPADSSPPASPRPVSLSGQASSFGAVGNVIWHQFQRNKPALVTTLLNSLIGPTAYLLAIGWGLGSQISQSAESQFGSTSYIAFIGPALAVVTALQASAMESTWPTLGLLRWQGTYLAVLNTPVSASQLALGHLGWLSVRATVSAACFTLVLFALGTLSSAFAVAVPLIAGLVSLIHAGPIVAYAVGVRDPEIFAVVNRLIIFPMVLFSGVFFPIEQLPEIVQWLIKLLPSWHGVELARSVTTGTFGTVEAARLAALIVLAAAGCWICARQFREFLKQ